MSTGTMKIQTLLEYARRQDSARTDYRASTDNLFVDQFGRLDVRGPYEIVNAQDVFAAPAPMNLTSHALGQIAQRLDIAYGRAFLSNNPSLPAETTADILNHFLDRSEPKDFLVRQYDNEVRGILSNKFLIMDHAWVLEQAKTAMTDPFTGEVADHIIAPGWRLEADYMTASIFLKTYRPDSNGNSGNVFGLGARIRNGTVGNASTGVSSVIMRTSCTNSIADRRTDWTVRHVGSTDILALRESLIIAAFAEAFQYSKELADAMIRARQQRLPNIFDIINNICDGQKVPNSLEALIVSGTEQEDSLFGLVNGITYAAHRGRTEDIIDADTSENLEAFGGLLLSKFADGVSEGDALAKALFKEAKTSAHILVGDDN